MKKNNFFLVLTLASALSLFNDVKAGNIFQDSFQALQCAFSYIGLRTANSLHATREYLDCKFDNIKHAFCRFGQKCKAVCTPHKTEIIVIKE